MKMDGRGRKVGLALAAAVVVAGAAYGWARASEPAGEEAPDFAVQLLHGGVLSLDDLEGQVVLVNFWATWCPPCRQEMPGFQRVYEARRDDGFTVLGLSTDRIPDGQIRWFLEQQGIEYMVARATAQSRVGFGGARSLPTSFLIDADGRVRKKVVGVYHEKDLVEDVDRLLREAGMEPTGEVAVAPGPEAPSWLEAKEVGHPLGREDAPVTVVEFSDYGCGYCSRFSQQTFPALYQEFIEAGRVRWVHVPFVLGKFANSEAASTAAVCAGRQGPNVFWGVHLALFRRQPEWREGDPLPAFRRYVEEAGGDPGRFEACYTEGLPRDLLVRAQQVATAAGVGSTPTFFINGRRFQGARPLSDFRAAILQAEGR